MVPAAMASTIAAAPAAAAPVTLAAPYPTPAHVRGRGCDDPTSKPTQSKAADLPTRSRPPMPAGWYETRPGDSEQKRSSSSTNRGTCTASALTIATRERLARPLRW